MKRSTDRILTTHTGSLPRSPEQQERLRGMEEQADNYDQSAFEASVREAVSEVVGMQLDAGIDVINDGEQGRTQYAAYVKERLTGFDGERQIRTWARSEDDDFPEFAQIRMQTSLSTIPQPVCTGPIAWKDFEAVQKDIDNLKAGVGDRNPEEVFMTAASPGVIANFLPNEHYPDYESYLYALADVMKDEYSAIVNAGYILQLDCPDLAMTRHSQFANLTNQEFCEIAELHVNVINHALDGLPPDRMRLHLCWGNYEGPHNHDIPLNEIVNIILKARPHGLSFEASNPRHAHEWRVWKDVDVPDEKVLIPGVLDTTSNFVEHPELVADRILRYAEVLGRDNVIASTDCGFGTSAWNRKVDTRISWAKLKAMTEGARLASEALW